CRHFSAGALVSSPLHPSPAPTPLATGAPRFGYGRQLQVDRPDGHALADLSPITALRHLRLWDSLKVQTGSSHGKAVAASGGILYTSTSYLRIRGRRSHEHRRPLPWLLRGLCSTKRPRTS